MFCCLSLSLAYCCLNRIRVELARGGSRRDGGGGRDGGRRGDDDRGGHGRGGDRFERGASSYSVFVANTCCSVELRGFCCNAYDAFELLQVATRLSALTSAYA